METEVILFDDDKGMHVDKNDEDNHTEMTSPNESRILRTESTLLRANEMQIK